MSERCSKTWVYISQQKAYFTKPPRASHKIVPLMLQFNAKSLGYKGEALAAEFLRSKGYEILHSNFTVRGGEIDLIVRPAPLCSAKWCGAHTKIATDAMDTAASGAANGTTNTAANDMTGSGGAAGSNIATGNILVFVEVKTRSQNSFGSGDESMDKFKKRRIYRAIQRYLDRHFPESEPDYRVDLVEINLDMNTGAVKRIEHFEDIEM